MYQVSTTRGSVERLSSDQDQRIYDLATVPEEWYWDVLAEHQNIVSLQRHEF